MAFKSKRAITGSIKVMALSHKIIASKKKEKKPPKKKSSSVSSILPPSDYIDIFAAVEELVNKTTAQKKKKKGAVDRQQIYQWNIESGKQIAGVKALYTVSLWSDGSLSCNCPGWVFKKSGQKERSCKHTEVMKEQAADLFKDYKVHKGKDWKVVIMTTSAATIKELKEDFVRKVDID